MILIIAIDDSNGMAFNNRRQSQDREVRTRIISLSAGSRLWVNHYTARQFEQDGKVPAHLNVDEAFLTEAAPGEYCFAENVPVAHCEKWVEKIILFKWNRRYPADTYFDIIEKKHWNLTSVEEFAGSSHEKITMEVYIKNENKE